MKIAFLFMFYDDHCKSDLMQEYFSEGAGKHNIYTHFKNPDGHEKSEYFGKFVIPKHIETEHIGISLIECQLNLLEAALKQPDNEWFVFMSDSCFPIKPLNVLYDFLRSSRLSFFNVNCHEKPPLSEQSLNDWIGEWNETGLRYDFSNFKKHSQWVILNRMDAEILAKTKSQHLSVWKDLENKLYRGKKNPNIFKNRKFAKDEFYPLAVLNYEVQNYQYNDRATTYVRWPKNKDTSRPTTFDSIDYLHNDWKSSFFIRKINNKTIIKL
jgi:hypothetical protein